VAATRTDHGRYYWLRQRGQSDLRRSPKKETGKSFNDAIKDLFWDVLGREPRPEELSAYSRDFGAKIDSDEEQIFFDRSQQEIKNRNDPILNLYKEATGGREPGLEEYRETRKELGGDISAEERAGFLESYVDPSFKEQYKTLSPSDPVYRLFSQELGRKPTLQEYRQFEGTFGATPTEQQRRAVRAVDPEVYGTRLIDQYRYMTGGQDPSEAQRRLVYQGGQENFTPQNLGEYLASQNLAGRDRYGASPTAGYVAKNLPSNMNPFTRTQGYVPLSRPNVSSTMNQAGNSITRHRHQWGLITLERPLILHQLPKVSSRLDSLLCRVTTHNHSNQWAARAGFSSNRSPEAKSYPVNKRLHNSFNQWAARVYQERLPERVVNESPPKKPKRLDSTKVEDKKWKAFNPRSEGYW
jgi:hypothetical protein